MAPGAIVFAMANPMPEVQPEEVRGDVAIMATGRSDYPNQINNVLAFPGVFRGALDVRARTINEEMKLAAAQAIARVIPAEELHADYIIPSVFNREVAAAVAEGVADAAVASGVARRKRERDRRAGDAAGGDELGGLERLAGAAAQAAAVGRRAQQRDRDGDPGEHADRAELPRERVARGERVAEAAAVVDEPTARGRWRSCPSAAMPDRRRDLQRRVDDARGQAGVGGRHVGHRERHQRQEREPGAEPEQQERRRARRGSRPSGRRAARARAARAMISASPASSIRSAPKRRISRGRGPSESAPSTSVIGRNASPVCERAVAAHALEVERAEDEGREHAGDQEAAHDARAPSAPRTRRMRSGKIGFAQRATRARAKAPSSASARAAEAERVRRAPAVLGRP